MKTCDGTKPAALFAALVSAGVVLCLPMAGFTANENGDNPELRLVFFSDVHARTEWGTPEAMKIAAEAINDVQADLVLGGGDLITDGFQSGAAAVESRWDAYMAFHEMLDGTVHTAIGNHDLVGAIPEDGTEPSTDPRAEFRRRLGVDRTYYSFDINGYHVIVLDSIRIAGQRTKYQGLVSREQMDWLEQDLRDVPANQPVIAVMHIPLVTSFFMMTDGPTVAAPTGRVVVNSLDLLDAFRDHNLILVLQGHMHVSESIKWRNTTYITGGAISGRWWRGEYQGTDAGFTVVTLNGNDIDWEYRTYGWTPRRPPNQ